MFSFLNCDILGVESIKQKVGAMGMTDKQFNAYLRGLKNRLEQAIEFREWQLVEELLEEIRQSIEDSV